MENTSYGINVANRYDLFCIDDDAGDPMEAILKNKQKQQKKQQAASAAAAATGAPAPGAAAAAASGAQPQQPSAQAKSNAKGGGEKENKSAGGRGAENRHPDKSAAQTNGTGNLHNQRGTERRGIKETQKDNIRNQENQKTGGVGGAGTGPKLPRGTGPNHKNGILAPGGAGGNDDKYRKTRDFDDGQRKPYPQNGGAAGGGPKRFDGRGKRELDRQSGSNKTGIKSVDKRDGAGSHNWGSSKQDAKEFSNLQDQEYQPQDADTSADEKTNPERTNAANGGEGEAADGAANAKSEDEAKEMTLDEWKAQKAAVRLKPQYNLRKAGEGEDSAQWDKMVALDRKPVKGGEAGSAAEAEDDENNDTQKAAAGGKGGKQVLDIEFHFNDNRRGGLGRTRGGRGGKGGGRGMGRDGPGGRRGDFGGENYRSSGAGGEHGYHQDGGAGAGAGAGGGGGGAPEGGMERPQRDNVRRNNRPPFAGGAGGPDRSYDGGMNKYSRPNPRASKQQHAPAAPKVDDEHDFPSLG